MITEKDKDQILYWSEKNKITIYKSILNGMSALRREIKELDKDTVDPSSFQAAKNILIGLESVIKKYQQEVLEFIKKYPEEEAPEQFVESSKDRQLLEEDWQLCDSDEETDQEQLEDWEELSEVELKTDPETLSEKLEPNPKKLSEKQVMLLRLEEKCHAIISANIVALKNPEFSAFDTVINFFISLLKKLSINVESRQPKTTFSSSTGSINTFFVKPELDIEKIETKDEPQTDPEPHSPM